MSQRRRARHNPIRAKVGAGQGDLMYEAAGFIALRSASLRADYRVKELRTV
jgi:hypothetical protein